MAFRRVAALTLVSAALFQNGVEADRDTQRVNRGRAASISSQVIGDTPTNQAQQEGEAAPAPERKSQTWTNNSPKVYFDKAVENADQQLKYAETLQTHAKQAADSMQKAAHHLDLYHKDIITLNEKLPLLDEIPSAINKHVFAELAKEEEERVKPTLVSEYDDYYTALNAFKDRVEGEQKANDKTDDDAGES